MKRPLLAVFLAYGQVMSEKVSMMNCRHLAGDLAPDCVMCQDLERLISIRILVLLH